MSLSVLKRAPMILGTLILLINLTLGGKHFSRALGKDVSPLFYN
ncbi:MULTISPECIES: hypothetical protein [Rodentibacter]|nr:MULTISPECIES: hypothetical protein [Rodentibacter]